MSVQETTGSQWYIVATSFLATGHPLRLLYIFIGRFLHPVVVSRKKD
jgi:hypothetical protein